MATRPTASAGSLGLGALGVRVRLVDVLENVVLELVTSEKTDVEAIKGSSFES